ncbi:amino acid adenylation domain-containing protein [Nocardia aurantia]|uniref:D-alanine--poly(Phosphoribitol) ligase subunit 1 n=1 Tax=Nocardia aurantia TaxID=2585199 RepID=A0A7K0DPZ4_9NOCA|nr:amino acid adenylation domain-containing protein [Nocardia aurantia]MQY27836.1 D-alanine--poly(phosphoribitol) ligase subunit 1 [Nocardia aurantia]
MHTDTLVDLLAGHVAATPDAVACADDRHTLTYRELAARSAAAATVLRTAGVAPGDTVGVLLRPSVQLVVAVWAVLRAGAAYLPLAVDYPAERLAAMVADAGAAIVATDAGTDDKARHSLPGSARPLRLDDRPAGDVHAVGDDVDDGVTTRRHRAATAPSGGGRPLPPADRAAAELPQHVSPHPAAPAYTIYTSGTTGTPKGVVIPHRAIAHQMRWLRTELGLGPGARILLKSPASFDAAQWELLANAVGATVVAAPAGTHARPEAILAQVLRHDITVLQCVPTVWAELAALPALASARSLRTIASGGEALPATVARRLRSVLPGVRKVNLYGPTEATINATWFDFTDADLDADAVVPIGGPVPGCRLLVVDESGARAREGELLIGGVQLAIGYHERPETTARRFVRRGAERWYRTGDLVRYGAGGALEFRGRTDDQVKVDGHRIETGEVRFRLESHRWVRSAAVVPWVTARGATRLAGFVELDPEQAPLMDEGAAARHHRSKSTRTQVTAQLSDLGVREVGSAPETVLAGADPTTAQRRRVFARKTYRRFGSAPVPPSEIEAVLHRWRDRRPGSAGPSAPALPDAAQLGRLLRWFGPFHSPDRLLPKYSYASPGALNATQIYVEIAGVAGIADGIHYFHPARHALYRVAGTGRPGIRLHLVGLPRVIESVYATNVREVLQFEAGHLLGVLDEVAAESGWWVNFEAAVPIPGVTEGIVTASARLCGVPRPEFEPPVTAWVQVHGEQVPARPGLHRFTGTGLSFVTDQKIERRHVVAINQRSYDDSAFAVVLTTGPEAGWDGFTALGRALAHLQQLGTRAGLGFMSAGYASSTGRDLPSARRFDDILGLRSLSYFALAGPVTGAQLTATGMDEDAVHMRGPEELLADDLRAVLPAYMVPATIHLIDRIPLSRNGKQDRAALSALAAELAGAERRADPPASAREQDVARVWGEVLGYEPVYRDDDFFAQGGNSMSALRLIRTLSEQLGVPVPVRTLFRHSTLAELAAATSAPQSGAGRTGRLQPLAGTGTAGATVLWPGLGGYPMSLRALARELAQDGHTVHGMQARGLEPGEAPHDDLAALIADDVAEVRRLLPSGPLRLVGYSFGARIAAEVATRLRAAGRPVTALVLIAPGSPVLPGLPDDGEVDYVAGYFKRVLASVFGGGIDPPFAAELDTAVRTREQFVDLIVDRVPGFARETVERIVAIVERTYRFRAEPSGADPELLDHSVFLRARGDGPSFADIPVPPLRERARPVGNLPYHHYEIVTAGALDIAAAVLEHSMSQELVPHAAR